MNIIRTAIDEFCKEKHGLVPFRNGPFTTYHQPSAVQLDIVTISLTLDGNGIRVQGKQRPYIVYVGIADPKFFDVIDQVIEKQYDQTGIVRLPTQYWPADQ